MVLVLAQFQKVMKERLITVEVWILQYMLRISGVRIEVQLMKAIRQRQLNFLGHEMRMRSRGERARAHQ